MADVLLLTGANGIVGAELAAVLARETDAPRVVLLVRGDDAELDAKRRWLLETVAASNAAHASTGARLEVVRGDVTLPDLGMAPATLRELTAVVTGVLHAAASTSFAQTAEQGEAGNVLGTRNALDFASRCARLDRFGLVSTVFVAGRRTGDVAEQDLDVEQGFCNEYERSKAMAEIVASKSSLPVATYRLGVVVGRRSDGRLSRMTGMYPVWRIFHQGLLSVLPGDPTQHIDLVPADFAAEATVHLLRRAFTAGGRYHVTAGPARSFTMEELFPFVAECIHRVEPDWSLRGYPLPASVDHAAFDDFAETTELVAHVSLRSVVRQLRVFSRQLAYPKRFATDDLDRALAGSGIELGHARTWLAPIVAHALVTSFRTPGWEVTHGAV